MDPVYGESDEEKSTAWEKYWLASFFGPAVFGRQTATLADPTTHHATTLNFVYWLGLACAGLVCAGGDWK